MAADIYSIRDEDYAIRKHVERMKNVAQAHLDEAAALTEQANTILEHVRILESSRVEDGKA